MKAICLPADREVRYYHGVCNSAIPQLLCTLKQSLQHEVHLVICNNSKELEKTQNDLIDFSKLYKKDLEIEIVVLPALPDAGDESPRSFDLECDRLTALSRMLDYRNEKQNKSLFVLTTSNGFFEATPKAGNLQNKELHLKRFEQYNYNELVESLGTRLAYSNEVLCEMPGQYAIRGGLLDIYPVNSSSPYRIDFFGDEIESIRTFDPATQRSMGQAASVRISCLPTQQTETSQRNIFDYFARNVAWIFIHPETLLNEHPDYFSVFEHSFSSRPSFQDLIDDRSKSSDSFIGIGLLETDNAFFDNPKNFYSYKTQELDYFREPIVENALGIERKEAEEKSIEIFFDQIKKWHKQKYKIRFFAKSESEKERIELRLKAKRMSRYKVEISDLRKGFLYEENDELSHVFITSNDIYSRHRIHPAHKNNRLLPQRQSVEQLLDFSELVEGDLLVHLANGVCRFRGIQEIEFKRGKEEVIALEFNNDSTLYLPLQESHLLTRYVGLSKSHPKLAKLGSNQWEKSRRAAEQATLDYAAALLKTQAERETLEGYAFAKDNEWQKSFEEAFPFEETRDQLRSINAVKEDMESSLSMDRLLCGDVGFGKTEVAIRAAFKAVMDGKQVAILVPTTVLAQQHYQTFKERMDAYPVTVEMVSRFRSKKEQKEILKQCNEGKVDILVGTHRLLSHDIVFKDLGLLVVDEEHRFGVKHKERLKELSYKVDILTMSATPIPRTLYMALVGVRKLSVIETPPVNRLPIQTVVKAYDLELIKKAIKHELDRSGQVFYLHNRVQSIESVAEGLRELLPNARIGVGHGQMTENALEKLMTQFVEAKYDVLVCTTIIESGLDIPNCNTIIIEGADKFGLAQLYQLRGRVGRFNKQAYAYLLLHQKTHILDQAKKRLGAIRQYNQLGAGYKIAMQDLELRGAGNILGMKQSGHIVSIGFDLYCQLLKQSISKLKGEESSSLIRASVSLDFIKTNRENTHDLMEIRTSAVEDSSLHDEAGFPSSYIPDAHLRIDFYRQLALVDSETSLENIQESLLDRFGKLPACVETLIELTKIRLLAELARVDLVEVTGDILRCRRASGKHDDYIKLTSQFPRLTRKAPLLRLREIQTFLRRHTHTV